MALLAFVSLASVPQPSGEEGGMSQRPQAGPQPSTALQTFRLSRTQNGSNRPTGGQNSFHGFLIFAPLLLHRLQMFRG